MFCSLSENIAKVLGIVRPGLADLRFVELYEGSLPWPKP